MSHDHFFRPSLTADVMVLRWGPKLEVLLIQRARDPHAGAWALPGGFIEAEETLLCSAQRELQEETGLKIEDLQFFGVFGDPGRDPRGRTITVAYRCFLPTDQPPAQAADDAKALKWCSVDALPELAFDHAKIIQMGLQDLEAERKNHYFQRKS